MNEQNLHHLLARIGSMFDADRRAAGQSFGLLPVQLEALRYLSRSDDSANSPIAVSEYLRLTKGTVSQTLKAIEAKGFLSRKADSQDRRVVHLSLTAKGKRAVTKAVPSNLVKKSLAEVSGNQQKNLQSGLERLLNAMHAASGAEGDANSPAIDTSSAANAMHDILARVGSAFDADRRAQGQPHGLLPVQLEALRYLDGCEGEGDSPIAVSDYLGLTKGTVSQTLKSIEAKGFLSRKTDSGDRRVIHLKLTAKGRRVIAKTVPTPVLSKALKSMSDAHKKALMSSLDKFWDAMQGELGKAKGGAAPKRVQSKAKAKPAKAAKPAARAAGRRKRVAKAA